MIVISAALALAPAAANPLGTPIFGWRNIATSMTATSAAAGKPAANLLNPSTALRWAASASGSTEYLTCPIASIDPIDYLAIAVHNLGTGQHPVSVEGSIDGGLNWSELVGEHI